MVPRTERAPLLSAVPTAARPYQGKRAGVVSRMTANVIDLLVVALIVCISYAVVAGVAFLMHPRSFHFPAELGWSIPVLGFVVTVPYLTLCWRTTGRTCGDMLLGLRVVNYEGQRLRFVGALLRALLCSLFPIGLLWVAVSPANRSVQDIVLRTSAVYDWLPAPE